MKKISDDILRNYRKVKEDIEAHHKNITLVAISKFQLMGKINKLLMAGHRCFGESRIDEAIDKWGVTKDYYENLELHFIGNIQSKRVKDIVSFFDVIQSLDRLSVAEKISIAAKNIDKEQRVLIQINIGNEPQKSGVTVECFDEFYEKVTRLTNIKVEGVMCIPPNGKDPGIYFKKMRDIACKYRVHHISMGMSNDYNEAMKYDATMIRVGSYIFGERNSI